MRISDWSSDVCSSDLPIGKELAGINDCSSRRDDGVPGHFWRFEFRMGIMVRDGLPVIMVAVGHNRIAVIQAFFDQVDFIAALRSEERRVGNESVSTCRSRGSVYQ